MLGLQSIQRMPILKRKRLFPKGYASLMLKIYHIEEVKRGHPKDGSRFISLPLKLWDEDVTRIMTIMMIMMTMMMMMMMMMMTMMMMTMTMS